MRVVIALGVLLAVGCGPERVRWQPRATPGSGALAVVWLGTALRTRPDLRAPVVSIEGATGWRGAFGAGGTTTLRLRRARGGWAELETLGEPGEAVCAGAVDALAPYRLVLYANEGALARVTTREVTQSFDDGTSITLARGVPVEPLAGRLHRVHFGGLVTNLQLGPSDVGTRYLPSALEAGPPVAWIDGGAAVASALVIGMTGRVGAHRAEAVPVQRVEPRGSERLVTMEGACGQLRVRAPAHVVSEPGSALESAAASESASGSESESESASGAESESGAESAAESGAASASDSVSAPGSASDVLIPPPPGATVAAAPNAPTLAPATAFARAGAAVFWPDGRSAGEVASDAPLGDEADPAHGRRCFGVRGMEDIVLCFAASDVQGAGAAPRLGGTLAAPR